MSCLVERRLPVVLGKTVVGSHVDVSIRAAINTRLLRHGRSSLHQIDCVFEVTSASQHLRLLNVGRRHRTVSSRQFTDLSPGLHRRIRIEVEVLSVTHRCHHVVLEENALLPLWIGAKLC